MPVIDLQDAKTHLSRLLARVEAGETVTIARARAAARHAQAAYRDSATSLVTEAVADPTDAQTVKHIFAIRGYSNYGTSAYYVDPASGGAGVGWGDDVPPYGTATATKLMPLLGDRGYVW